MPPSLHMEVRPRTTGEILDDAWRLFRTDTPLLLAASGLFLLPAATALIIVLTQPFGDAAWARFLWPAVAAVLLPLSGLGAGACQEAFHLWTEDRPATLGRCLRTALRRGVNHVTAEAMVLALPLIGLAWLGAVNIPPVGRWVLLIGFLLCNLPVWVIGLSRHAVLAAGQQNLWRAWRLSRRATGRHTGRAVVLACARLIFLLGAAVNIHLFLALAFYAAEQLAGLDAAYLRVLLSPGNTTYVLIVLAFAWWLLSPYNEAVNYLFLVDARTRYDGLDLWYRIEESFPGGAAAKAGAVLLAVGLFLFGSAPAVAQDRLAAVRQARKDLAAVAREVKEAEPYPGGQQWQPPLREIGKRLDPEGAGDRGRYRWYHQAVDRFGQRDRAADVKALDEIDARLGLVEQSLSWKPFAQRGGAVGEPAPSAEEVRRLVPRGKEPPPKTREEKKPVEKDPPPRPAEGGDGPRRAVGGGGAPVVPTAAVGGLGYVCVAFIGALVLAVLLAGLFLLIRSLLQRKPSPKRGTQGMLEPGMETVLEEPDRQNVAALWSQSDDLARQGRFLEAVRTLYIAVLALLHQANLIRYERTRTNGEYADHLRRKGSPVHRPFKGLTGIFEVKWYGEKACALADYETCRNLAETIRQDARRTPPPSD
jgi:hypothetical protein